GPQGGVNAGVFGIPAVLLRQQKRLPRQQRGHLPLTRVPLTHGPRRERSRERQPSEPFGLGPRGVSGGFLVVGQPRLRLCFTLGGVRDRLRGERLGPPLLRLGFLFVGDAPLLECELGLLLRAGLRVLRARRFILGALTLLYRRFGGGVGFALPPFGVL